MSHSDRLPESLSAEYVEGLFAEYLENPDRLDPAWRRYFQKLLEEENGHAAANHLLGGAPTSASSRIKPSFPRRSIFHGAGGPAPRVQPAPETFFTPEALDAARLQERADMLIRAFRVRGHLAAKIDPLGLQRPEPRELDPAFYGFTEKDLDHPFSTRAFGGPMMQTLRGIIERLRATYCRHIAVQFMHIDDLEVRTWLQERMEATENRLNLSHDTQIRILTRLTQASVFELFVRKKFIGAKTFSLEGSETLIPLLHLAIEKAGRQGVREIVMGMAHRGRLNVLVNILGKSPRELFREFEDIDVDMFRGAGDVKYHLGYSSDWYTVEGEKIHLSLCFNPSHLEFVNPVALGRTRAKQDRAADAERRRGLTLLIHGDAAFAGEGVVQETLNLSQLRGYRTGGTLHVVVNNQLGFTTNPEEGRSSVYATDVGRMLQIPIFHVNGEDPEGVAQCVELAMDFRSHFQRDVVIDMYCYRRLGHNESDEPSFTQPVMYREIEHRSNVRKHYQERLMELGEVTSEEAEEIAHQGRQYLNEGLEKSKGEVVQGPSSGRGIWKGYLGGEEPGDDAPETHVSPEQFADILTRLTKLPEGFRVHPKLTKFHEDRLAMAAGEKPVDWSAAEALAFGSLVLQGRPVRLSGQDCKRGTFSHRHATLYDHETGEQYTPLRHLSETQAGFEVLNSPLSEAGVLGFEYGYSLDCPEGLILWEAQFGDFVNAAQVIIDQFITSAEDKWKRLSGLVMLLPHGFEGQGPEHSSARMERFLTQAAENNIQIAQPSTPAQYFHLLRRQVLRRWRKPLIVFTPKSLLRNPRVVSTRAELTEGHFRRVLPDQRENPQETRRILLCTGKVYYDLIEAREKHQQDDVAILRLEQLYPFPEMQLREALSIYADDTPLVWVQEEPENMGAWWYLKVRLGHRAFDSFPLMHISRSESASPATGSHSTHKLEQEQLISAALENTAGARLQETTG
jgi:2-oxoglutarate dehydrogenase E1 component